LTWRRVSQLYDLTQSVDCAGHLTLWLSRPGQFKQKSLLAFQEAQFEPAEQIIGQRLGVANLWIARPPAWLKPRVAEFVAQDAQRDAILQRQGHCCCERIHETGNRRAFLRHSDEQFAWQTIFVQTNSDIALLPARREVMRRILPACSMAARRTKVIPTLSWSSSKDGWSGGPRALGNRSIVAARCGGP